VDIVSRSGSNAFHGSLFEYLRNDKLDARSPFDPAKIPPFRLNQFGASLGGYIKKDRTFFFADYEGLTQRWGRTLTAYVPTDSYRAATLAKTPEVAPLLNAFPHATAATASADIGLWSGPGSQNNDQHSGMLRVDHRLTDSDLLFARFSSDAMAVRTPLGDTTGYMGANNRVDERVTTGVVDYQRAFSPRLLNDLRAGVNRVPYHSQYDSPILPALKVSGFTSIPGGRESMVNSTTYTISETATLLLGRHTLKAGLDVRRLGFALRTVADGSTLTYTNPATLATNTLTTAVLNGFLPTRGVGKTQYFGFVQDEVKLAPELTATVGLRYESFGVLSERYGRAQVFDLPTCGGFCPAGAEFTSPDRNNLAPRLSLAWAPRAMKGRTVVRTGFVRWRTRRRAFRCRARRSRGWRSATC
jgi:hypothetical protein